MAPAAGGAVASSAAAYDPFQAHSTDSTPCLSPTESNTTRVMASDLPVPLFSKSKPACHRHHKHHPLGNKLAAALPTIFEDFPIVLGSFSTLNNKILSSTKPLNINFEQHFEQHHDRDVTSSPVPIAQDHLLSLMEHQTSGLVKMIQQQHATIIQLLQDQAEFCQTMIAAHINTTTTMFSAFLCVARSNARSNPSHQLASGHSLPLSPPTDGSSPQWLLAPPLTLQLVYPNSNMEQSHQDRVDHSSQHHQVVCPEPITCDYIPSWIDPLPYSSLLSLYNHQHATILQLIQDNAVFNQTMMDMHKAFINAAMTLFLDALLVRSQQLSSSHSLPPTPSDRSNAPQYNLAHPLALQPFLPTPLPSGCFDSDSPQHSIAPSVSKPDSSTSLTSFTRQTLPNLASMLTHSTAITSMPFLPLFMPLPFLLLFSTLLSRSLPCHPFLYDLFPDHPG